MVSPRITFRLDQVAPCSLEVDPGQIDTPSGLRSSRKAQNSGGGSFRFRERPDDYLVTEDFLQ
jgi:hypothetical protein